MYSNASPTSVRNTTALSSSSKILDHLIAQSLLQLNKQSASTLNAMKLIPELSNMRLTASQQQEHREEYMVVVPDHHGKEHETTTNNNDTNKATTTEAATESYSSYNEKENHDPANEEQMTASVDQIHNNNNNSGESENSISLIELIHGESPNNDNNNNVPVNTESTPHETSIVVFEPREIDVGNDIKQCVTNKEDILLDFPTSSYEAMLRKYSFDTFPVLKSNHLIIQQHDDDDDDDESERSSSVLENLKEIDVGNDVKLLYHCNRHEVLVDFPNRARQQQNSSSSSSSLSLRMSSYYKNHFAMPTFDVRNYYYYADSITPITWNLCNHCLDSIGPHKLCYRFMGLGARLGERLSKLGPYKLEYNNTNLRSPHDDRISLIGDYDLSYDEEDGKLKWVGDWELSYDPKTNRLIQIGPSLLKYGVMGRLNMIGPYVLEYGYLGQLNGIRMYGEPLTEDIMLILFLAVRHLHKGERIG